MPSPSLFLPPSEASTHEFDPPSSSGQQTSGSQAPLALGDGRGGSGNGAAICLARDNIGSTITLRDLVERAHALAGLGRCRLALDRADAAVPLLEAHAIFTGLGARLNLAEVDELLATAAPVNL